MGNNKSMIHITLDRTQPTIYYTGDIISGKVQFTVPERTNKINEIYLTITGDIGYTIIRSTRIQNGQTDRRTDRYEIRFFQKKISLDEIVSFQQEQASTIINGITTFEAGQYTYPFSVRLPDILPPTLHPQDYPFVRYELQLFIEKKWYSTDTFHRYPLRIYPRVNLLHINNAQCAIKFDKKHKDIIMKGIIQRSGLIPGEQTILSLEIYNPNHLVIKRIDICFIQRYEIEQCRRRLELIRLSIPQLFNINNEHIETTYPITIPKCIPPSYNFKGIHNHSDVYVNIHYDIKLEVKTKGFFSDFELQVPIIIGTDSVEYSNDDINVTTTLADLNTIDTAEPEIDDNDISPPSYDSLLDRDLASN